jgi:hypothetical protein
MSSSESTGALDVLQARLTEHPTRDLVLSNRALDHRRSARRDPRETWRGLSRAVRAPGTEACGPDTGCR